MKIALAGYGKMGHMIESIALKRSNDVVATIDYVTPDAKYIVKSSEEVAQVVAQVNADVVIDFTHPDEAFNNIKAFLPLGIPVVVALNKADINATKQTKIDSELLSNLLNCPVVDTISTSSKGLQKVVEKAIANI